MEWEQVYAALLRAKVAFLQTDRDLLAVNANERSMTHKFAEYLQLTARLECRLREVTTDEAMSTNNSGG